jgi:hypothetical protein
MADFSVEELEISELPEREAMVVVAAFLAFQNIFLAFGASVTT